MYSVTKQYYDFLEKQKKEKEFHLSMSIKIINAQMDQFMNQHGWERKGKGQKVMYTKKFNGKDIVIGFRCNLQDGIGDGGVPEFTHDKSIPDTIEKIQIGYFRWNDQDTGGWRLDVLIERMEAFYNRYTS